MVLNYYVQQLRKLGDKSRTILATKTVLNFSRTISKIWTTKSTHRTARTDLNKHILLFAGLLRASGLGNDAVQWPESYYPV